MKRPTIKTVAGGITATKRPRIVREGLKRPNFDSLFNPVISNPLDDQSGENKTLQETVDEEVSVVLQTILEERRQQRDQYRIASDTEYWVCLCFQSRAQKEEFLTRAGWIEHGDKYLDGLFCAQTMGIDVKPIELPMRRGTSRTPKILRNMEVIK